MINLLALFASSPSRTEPTVVSLNSGEPPHFFSTSVPGIQEFSIDPDGNCYYAWQAGANQQYQTANAWIRPVTEAPGTYQCRFTSATGSPLHSTTTAINVWHALSTGEWRMRLDDNDASPGSKSNIVHLEFRKGTGPVLVSADITMRAEYDAF